MRTTYMLVCALAVVACSKKKDDPAATAPASTPTAPAPASGDKPADTAAKPTEPAKPKRLYVEYNCEKVLPKELRDKYFAGVTFEEDTNDSNSGGCKGKDAEGSVRNFSAACFDAAPAGVQDSMMDRAKKNQGEAKEIAGVGKFAMYQPVGNLNDPNHTVMIFDDNSECTINALLDGKVDVTAFAKDAVALFPLK